jgi:hypothetical protein
MSSEHTELPLERAGNLVLAGGKTIGVFNTWQQAELCVNSVNSHQRLVQKLQAILDNADDFYSAGFADALESGADILTELEGDE